MNKLFTAIVLTASLAVGSISTAWAEVKFGVMAPRGALKAMKKWGDLGEYLQDQLGTPVKIVPLKPNETVNAVANGDVDYMLANPVLTVVLNKKLGTTSIATLHRKSGSQFGGVIIAKKGSGITKAADLKGKKVMGFKFKRSAAAYVFQVKHLMDQGIDPHKDFAVFKEAKKQDDIVLAVKAGLFDAGFVKSGLLEAMEKEGKVKLSDFEIVDEKDEGFAHKHSTILYPEWCVAASKNADAAITSKLTKALFAMNASTKASQTAKIVGLVEPLSLDNLDGTLKALGLPPYD